MDEIWKRIPYDILERIAHFADIDTRRAMGFGPRKIVVPDLNIHPPKRVQAFIYPKLRNEMLNIVNLGNGARILYDDDTYIFYEGARMKFKRWRFNTVARK